MAIAAHLAARQQGSQRREGPVHRNPVARTKPQPVLQVGAAGAAGAASWNFAEMPVRLPAGLQAKLNVGSVDDPLEREADAVAARMLRGAEPGPLSSAPAQAHRACAACQEDETVHRKEAASGPRGGNAPEIVESAISAPGHPLDRATRDFFEPRLGHDLGAVRISADALAARSAAAIGARAYTVGQRIVFGSGEFAPATTSGRTLLAHELAHTVQQGGRGAAPAEPTTRARHDDPIVRRQSVPPGSTPGAPGPRPGRIIAERTAPDGNVIDIEIGDSVERMGLENTLPSSTDVSLDGWHRAHQVGPGLGAESGSGIRYAPPEVNLKYQASGVERFIRMFNQEKDAGVRLLLRTVTKAHPNSLRLESITYRLSAARGDAAPTNLWEVSIEIANSTENPRVTLGQPELLGDYTKFLAPRSGPPHSRPSESSGPEAPSRANAPDGSAKASGPKATTAPDAQTPAAAGQSTKLAGGAANAAASENAVSVKVDTKIEVVKSVHEANGTTISDVEYDFAGGLDKINEGAPAGGGLPGKMVIEVTQSADGSIAAVKSLSGQPKLMVEALALKTLPGAGVEAVAAGEGTGAVAAATARKALLFKGLHIGGTAAFAIITGYEYFTATPKQRPRVLAGAAGGLAGGAMGGFVACNLVLDIETAGWGLLVCGLAAAGIGGHYGKKASEAIYDEATATELDRLVHTLSGKPSNEIGIFNVLVGKMQSDSCIDADFVRGFMQAFPAMITDAEAVLLAAQLAAMSIVSAPQVAPPRSRVTNPRLRDAVCPACHGRNATELVPSTMTAAEVAALASIPTCAAVNASALTALRTAVRNLPPRTRQQMTHPAYQAPTRPPLAANEHATPPNVMPPTARADGFPSEAEQLGTVCPQCHANSQHTEAWKSFGAANSFSGPPTPEDYQRLADYARASKP